MTTPGRAGHIVVITVVTIAALASCSLLHRDPVTAEERAVTAAANESMTVTLSEEIDWPNEPARDATRDVHLPPGRYVLEAEDGDYWYFRAPAALEIRVLRDGTSLGGRDIPGGLALGKASLTPTPPAAYIDVDADYKMLVMTLGSGFMLMRGHEWDASF